jgi:hypothetical protein
MPRNRLVLATVVAAEILAASLTGCGAQGNGTSTPGMTLDFSGARTREAAAVFGNKPGYSAITVFLEGDGSHRWNREVEIHARTAACMAERGFPDDPPLSYTEKQLTNDFIRPIHLPLTVSEAAQRGYASSDSAVSSAPRPPVTEQPAGKGQAYGDAEFHCGRAAMNSAFGSYEEYENLRQQLETKVVEFRKAFWIAGPVLALNRDWSRCVGGRGYHFDSPEMARQSATGQSSSTVERAIAVADATCRAEVNYDKTLLTLFDSAEGAFALDNESLILSLKQAGR